MRLNCASGDRPLLGFTNIDLSMAADVKDDMQSLSQFSDNCADEIRCDHGLEHILRDCIPATLATWFRVLKPGGKVQIDVPNLPEVVRNWLREYDRGNPDIWGWQAMTLFGRQLDIYDVHYWGFDHGSLTQYLLDAGFINVTVSDINSHDQPSLLAVAYKPA